MGPLFRIHANAKLILRWLLISVPIMGVELFGADHLVYFAIACFVAYAFSGHTGNYGSQRIAVPKPGEARHHLTLSQLRNVQNRLVYWLKERMH